MELKLYEGADAMEQLLLVYLEGDQQFTEAFKKYKSIHKVVYSIDNIDKYNRYKYWIRKEYLKIQDEAIKVMNEVNQSNFAGYVLDKYFKKYYPEMEQYEHGFFDVKMMRRCNGR